MTVANETIITAAAETITAEENNMTVNDNTPAAPLSMDPVARAARGESLTPEEEGKLAASDAAEFLAYLNAQRSYLAAALAAARAPKVPGKRGPQGPQRGKPITLADGRTMIVGSGLGTRAAFNAAKHAVSVQGELLEGDVLNVHLITFGADGSGVLYSVLGTAGETARGKGSPGVKLNCRRMDNGEEVVLWPTMESITAAVCITGSGALLANLPVLQAQKVRSSRKSPATV